MATGERHETCLLGADERITAWFPDHAHAHGLVRPEGGCFGHRFRRDGSPAGDIAGTSR